MFYLNTVVLAATLLSSNEKDQRATLKKDKPAILKKIEQRKYRNTRQTKAGKPNIHKHAYR